MINDLDITAVLEIPDELAADLGASVYRVVQEALTNVAKHARANAVSVSVARDHGRLTVSVLDDGCGFAVDQRAGPGFGLTGMRERVLVTGGELSLESSDAGTSIRAWFPLPA